MKIRLRLDVTEHVTEEVIVKFLQGCRRYVLVHHVLPTGNPHYHAFIDDGMVMSVNAYRQRVKRHFNTGRGDYSVQECSDDRELEYVQYLFNTKHGNISTLVTSVFDPDVLSECQRKAQEVSDAFKEKVQEKECKASRLTVFDIGMTVADIFDATHPDWDDRVIEKITRIAIKECYKNRQAPEPNKLNKIISVVLGRHEKGIECLVSKSQFYFSRL